MKHESVKKERGGWIKPLGAAVALFGATPAFAEELRAPIGTGKDCSNIEGALQELGRSPEQSERFVGRYKNQLRCDDAVGGTAIRSEDGDVALVDKKGNPVALLPAYKKDSSAPYKPPSFFPAPRRNEQTPKTPLYKETLPPSPLPPAEYVPPAPPVKEASNRSNVYLQKVRMCDGDGDFVFQHALAFTSVEDAEKYFKNGGVAKLPPKYQECLQQQVVWVVNKNEPFVKCLPIDIKRDGRVALKSDEISDIWVGVAGEMYDARSRAKRQTTTMAKVPTETFKFLVSGLAGYERVERDILKWTPNPKHAWPTSITTVQEVDSDPTRSLFGFKNPEAVETQQALELWKVGAGISHKDATASDAAGYDYFVSRQLPEIFANPKSSIEERANALLAVTRNSPKPFTQNQATYYAYIITREAQGQEPGRIELPEKNKNKVESPILTNAAGSMEPIGVILEKIARDTVRVAREVY